MPSRIALALLLLLPLSLSAQTKPHSVSGSFIASTTPGVTGYNVYRRTGSAPYAIFTSTAGTGWLDTTVLGGTTYFYSVTAVEPGAESPMSNEVTAAIPADTSGGGGGGTLLSFWSPTTTPANLTGNDSNSVELGIKFSSSVPGEIVSIRFYKATNATGTHTAHLWNPNGISLGNGTFTNETASGWQTFTFPTPIIITPGMVYTASYHTSQYTWNQPAFTTPLVVAPLTAPVSAGVYAYGSTSTFPKSVSSPTSNYWVDVGFLPSGTVPVSVTIAPTAISVFPGNTQQFTATVTGAAVTAVTWTATGGTITPTGLFTAGTTVGNTFAATATSVADAKQSASASVHISPTPPTLAMTCTGLVCTLTQTNNPSGTKFPVTATGPSGQSATATATAP